MTITTTTAVDRMAAFEAFATQFNNHLLDVPGVTLSTALRVAVAHCARDALECQACIMTLPRGVKLMPGTSIYDTVADIAHDDAKQQQVMDNHHKKEEHWTSFVALLRDQEDKSVLKKKIRVIETTVHCLVHHQHRLDKTWYDKTLDAMAEAEIVPSSCEEPNKTYLLYSAFCEILILTCVSLYPHMTFTIIGRPIPRLPTLEEVQDVMNNSKSNGPTLLDWTSLLNRQPPRRGDDYSHAAYLMMRDVNWKSPEWSRISSEAKSLLPWYMIDKVPYLSVTFGMEDVRVVTALHELTYVTPVSIGVCYSSYLNPRVYCTESFDRHDLEFLAVETSHCFHCDF